jgi:hypothetical protein
LHVLNLDYFHVGAGLKPAQWSIDCPRLQFGGERKERDILRTLDRHGKPALVPRARAGHAARKNLAALLNERRENLGAFIVDEVGLVDAKAADLLFADKVPLAAFRGAAWAASLRPRTTRPEAGRTRRT